MFGVALTVAAVSKTSLGEKLVGPRRLDAVQAVSLQKVDHGIPANLHFLPFPYGVAVEGMGTNDIQNIGVVIRVTLRGANGKARYNVEALVDSGADSSFISKDIADALGLEPIGVFNVDEGISSLKTPMSYYAVDVELPGGTIVPTKIGSTNRNGREEMLLGRDILSKGVFVYNGQENKATLSFPRG